MAAFSHSDRVHCTTTATFHFVFCNKTELFWAPLPSTHGCLIWIHSGILVNYAAFPSLSAYLIGILLVKYVPSNGNVCYTVFVSFSPYITEASVVALSTGETESTRLAEIQQTGANNGTILHGSCVPVGCTEPHCAPPGLRPMAGPNAAWGAWGWEEGLSQRVHCGSLPSYS